MKITIKKGASIEDVIGILAKFFDENFSDYPVLKNDMRIYVNLTNKVSRICPDNEQEYILSKSEPIKNVFEEEKVRAKEDLMRDWELYIHYTQMNVRKLKKKVELGNNYIETAYEKARKEENIAKRKIQLDLHRKELEKAVIDLEFVKLINDAIKNNKYKTYYEKINYRSSYNYILNVSFIFECIEGFPFYFDNHGLHKGIPKY